MGNGSTDYSILLLELENLVVTGQHDTAKQMIKNLNLKRIPREAAGPMAEKACRISEPLLALKILNRFIHPENPLEFSPSDKEKLFYATALSNLGAVDEALQLLDNIDPKIEPEVDLRKAMANFRAWNYVDSIPLLKNFIKTKNLTNYRKLIGQVNLAAALVVDGQYEEGTRLLSEIKETCKSNNYFLLLGNTLELQAQVHFFQGHYDRAISTITESIELLKNESGEFYLFAEKWKVITQAFQNRTSESLKALEEFNLKVKNLGHAETSRECDLFNSILTNDESLARKVIFGTPFEYYRQRARRLYGKNILPQGHYILLLEDSSLHSLYSNIASPKAEFHFSPYEIQNGNEGLYNKPQLLALFEALTMDFYKPSHIGLLFQRIYKAEKFNPFTSPKRVLTLMKRLNQWFQENQVPLKVKIKKSEFALMPSLNQKVFVQVQRAKNLSKQKGQLFYLRHHFKDRTFSSKSVSEKLSISKSSAQSLITEALQKGFLVKKGSGRSTVYALNTRVKRKTAA